MLGAARFKGVSMASITEDISSLYNGNMLISEGIVKDIQDHEFKFDGNVINIWAKACGMTTSELVSFEYNGDINNVDYMDIPFTCKFIMPNIPITLAKEISDIALNELKEAQNRILLLAEELCELNGFQKPSMDEMFKRLGSQIASQIPEEDRKDFLELADPILVQELERILKI